MYQRPTVRHVRAFSTSLPPPATRTSSRPPSGLAVTVALVTCSISTMGLILLNKLLLNGSEFKAPHGLAMICVQLGIGTVILEVAYWLSVHRLVERLAAATAPVLPSGWIDREAVRHAWPVSIAYAFMLATNTMALRYLNAASFQMARYMSILFAIPCVHLLLDPSIPNGMLIAAAMAILAGWIEQQHNLFFTGVGFCLALAASLSIALFNTVVKRAQLRLGNSVCRILRYIVPMAAVQLFPVAVISGEWSELSKVYFLYSPGFWLLTAACSGIGLLLAVILHLQIRYASPLLSILANSARLALQTTIVGLYAGGPIDWRNGLAAFIFIAATVYGLRAQCTRIPNYKT